MDETLETRKSVLDDLGQEVAGIAAPVSVCMFLTVLLVRILNPKGDNQQDITVATIYYHEKASARGLSFSSAGNPNVHVTYTTDSLKSAGY
jgi:hypothetical protein